MADPLDVENLKRKIGTTDITDDMLGTMLDENGGDLNATAASIWNDKASEYAELVDITEAGSSRKNSALFTNAKAQAAYYSGLTVQDDPDPQPGAYSTTRAIVRP